MYITLLSAAVDILEWANGWWNARMGEAFEFLTTPPPNIFSSTSGESFAWRAMESVHSALLPAATTILAIIFMTSLIRSTTDFQQTQSKETMMRHITQFVFSYTIMRSSLLLFKGLIWLIQDLVNAAWRWTTGRDVRGSMIVYETLPGSIIAKMNRAGTWDKIIYIILAFVMALAIFVISIRILLIVYSRFFKIFMYVAISAVPLTFFASAEHRHTAWRFIKSFFALLLVGVIIIVASIIYFAVLDAIAPPDDDTGPPPVSASSPYTWLLDNGCPTNVIYLGAGVYRTPELNPQKNAALRNWLAENLLTEVYQNIYDAFYETHDAAADRQEIFVYLGWRVFLMFLLMSIISSAEPLAKEMIA